MYAVKKIVNGKPLYLMSIDEEDNAIWVNGAIYAHKFQTSKEAWALAIQRYGVRYLKDLTKLARYDRLVK